MEVFILSKAQFAELTSRLDTLQNLLNTTESKGSKKSFMDNEEFLQLMGVSKRTAQSWRDEGIISFSQVGNKIYYKMSDVDKLLAEHYKKSFKR
ncbi:helix-turn-helix domain-containing protein [Flavobacterium sp.]|uniref:helix-turn-helix domain-containing protein n=1 Tax=Flavobacterium sp. TaxID=239 RepID=UPI003D6A1DF9